VAVVVRTFVVVVVIGTESVDHPVVVVVQVKFPPVLVTVTGQ